MDKVKIGIYEKALPPLEHWEQRFEVAKRAGYDFIEIAIDESDARLERLDWSIQERSDFHKAALNTNLGLNSIVLSAHRRFPMGSVNSETRKQALDILYKAVDFAVDAGFRMIQLAGYYVFYESHTDENYDFFCESLAMAIEYASQAGVLLALENVDGEDILTVEKIVHFVNLFNSPYLQAYPDVGNLSGNGFDVEAELRKGAGHFVGIHLKDVKPNVFRRIPFGEGIVPFDRVFKTLAEVNYTGNFLIEMWNDNSPESMQIVTSAKQWVIAKLEDSGLLVKS